MAPIAWAQLAGTWSDLCGFRRMIVNDAGTKLIYKGFLKCEGSWRKELRVPFNSESVDTLPQTHFRGECVLGLDAHIVRWDIPMNGIHLNFLHSHNLGLYVLSLD